jgi:adenylosuccinate lyase
VDNADSIRAKEALEIVETKLVELLKAFKEKIEKYKDFACIGYTHLQPAEPTALGYRFSMYAQDLVWDLKLLRMLLKDLKSKGFKGAVGTGASYSKLFGEEGALEFESQLMSKLGINSATIAAQTTPRKIDFFISSVLSSISQSLYKFAFDLRVLQSPNFGELAEPFSKNQVGSSAMPHKRNPIKSEQICSLARLVLSLSNVASENASLSLLERTLDDSANRRIYMPEMFLSVDEMLGSAIKIVSDLTVNEARVQENLERYAPFALTEEIIIESVKKGADRQLMHETLRNISMEAWSLVSVGEENPMIELLGKSEEILKYIEKEDIKKMLSPEKHLGTVVIRTNEFLEKELKPALKN